MSTVFSQVKFNLSFEVGVLDEGGGRGGGGHLCLRSGERNRNPTGSRKRGGRTVHNFPSRLVGKLRIEQGGDYQIINRSLVYT